MGTSRKAPSPENEFRQAAVVEDLDKLFNPRVSEIEILALTNKFRSIPDINKVITKNTVNFIFDGTVIDLFAVVKNLSFQKIGKYFFLGKLQKTIYGY